jgi:hypothetical protein
MPIGSQTSESDQKGPDVTVSGPATLPSMTAEMPDRPASSESSTGLNKANDAAADPIPELSDAVRHFLSGTGLTQQMPECRCRR